MEEAEGTPVQSDLQITLRDVVRSRLRNEAAEKTGSQSL